MMMASRPPPLPAGPPPLPAGPPPPRAGGVKVEVNVSANGSSSLALSLRLATAGVAAAATAAPKPIPVSAAVAAEMAGVTDSEPVKTVAALEEAMMRHFNSMSADDAAVHTAYYRSRFASEEDADEESKVVTKAQGAVICSCCAALLRGLRWTLHYYLLGTPSWSWYFPYHHAPLLTDVAALLRVAPNTGASAWPPSRPLRPFEQLLSVLPPASSRLLPGPYKELLDEASAVGSTHTLAPFFPHEYAIEPDPKGREWRDIALIPFIEAPALLREVAKIPDDRLTEEERVRNSRGTALAFAYDATRREPVRSPLYPRMPHLPGARSVELRIGGAPPSDKSRGVGDAPPEPLTAMRGWPSLSMRVPFSMVLQKAGLSLECLGVTSRGLSWILQLPGAHALGASSIDGFAHYVLDDDPVWVDWPFATEARVVCVTTPAERIWRDRRGKLGRCDVHPTEWKELASSLHDSLLNNSSIECGEVLTVLYVVRLLGHSRLPDGTLVRRWARESIPVPAQLVQPGPAHGAPEPAALARAAAAARMSVGARVLVLEGPHAGCVGVVEGVTEQATASKTETEETEAAAEAAAAAAAEEAAAEAEAAAQAAAAAEKEASGGLAPPGPGASEEEQLAWAMQESMRVSNSDADFEQVTPALAKKPAGPPPVAPPQLPALVDVKIRPRPPLPSLPMVAPERGQSERDLAQRLSLQPIVLARITGTVSLVDKRGDKHEVGLGIKSRRQRLVAVGWVRLRANPSSGSSQPGEMQHRDRETWEYSNLAERTLRAYRAAFPSLFSRLELHPKDDTYALEDVFPASAFPGAEDSGWGPSAAARKPAGVEGEQGDGKGGGLGANTAEERLAELVDFLKGTGVRSARLVPADMMRLSVDSVEIAQSAIETSAKETANTPPAPLVILRLPVRALLRPTDVGVQLAGLSTVHAPGEHVVYIRNSGPVPFGERGVVVAVQGTRCEVLFEREGYCGTGHFAQLRSCRGAVLPSAALLNLTRPLPAAYRLSAAGSHGARAATAAGLDTFYGRGGGGANPYGSMRRQHAGLPANIWTLLEIMDAELKEPEWEQPGAEPSRGEADADEGEGGAVLMTGKARRRARQAERLAAADLGDLDWA